MQKLKFLLKIREDLYVIYTKTGFLLQASLQKQKNDKKAVAPKRDSQYIALL
jgi:hypothetical protein